MSSPSLASAQWTENADAAPRIADGYPVRDAHGRWTWSAVGPAEAGVVTRPDGLVGLNVGGAGTWQVAITDAGAPIIYGI